MNQPLIIDINSLTDFKQEVNTFATLARNTILNERVKYPEPKFTHFFAPIFLGFQQPAQGQNVYSAWQSEVGSLHIEVDVVDVAGNVLFTVPPLMDTSSINLQQAEVASPTRFNQIKNNHDQEAQNFSEIATQRFYESLAQKLQNIFSFNKMNSSSLQKWLLVFQHYNVSPDVLIERARTHLGNEAVNSAIGLPVQDEKKSGVGGMGFDSQINY